MGEPPVLTYCNKKTIFRENQMSLMQKIDLESLIFAISERSEKILKKWTLKKIFPRFYILVLK